MKIKLHGVRGSYPTANKENAHYGGNTPCVEVIEGDQRIILDAGTGIIGIDFDNYYQNPRIDILLTHLHMDHIQGLGFCKPLFNPKKEVHIWGPGGSTHSLLSRLNRFLSPPLFPVVLRDIPCKLVIHEITNSTFELGNFKITSEFINHPGPTMGYRVQANDRTLTYIPDHEPVIGKNHLFPEDKWTSGFDLAYDSDVLIHDSQYSPKEYTSRIGWGHCPINIAAEFSSRTNVKNLILFHHDPSHSDTKITEMLENLQNDHQYSFNIAMAVQGDEIEV